MKELSGDGPLTRGQQLQYMVVWASRVAGLFSSQPTTFFVPPVIPTGSSSPLRKYIDAFFEAMLSQFHRSGSVTVFDIGCGSGYVRQLLAERGYSGSYTGLDIVREKRFDTFETSAFTSRFIQSPIETFVSEGIYDFVISNTSLEHVESDTTAVAIARTLAGNRGVQIHIVPSWWSFPLYVWHGYRHYTPGALKKLFDRQSYDIYRFGGISSFFFHFIFITLLERYLKSSIRQRPWYPRMAEIIIRLDRYLPLMPVGYGIVVYGKEI